MSNIRRLNVAYVLESDAWRGGSRGKMYSLSKQYVALTEIELGKTANIIIIIVVIMSLVTGLFFLALLLNQR